MAQEQQENQNKSIKSADEALDSFSARIAERQFQKNMEKGIIKLPQEEKKVNTTAESQKEANATQKAPKVEEKKEVKEEEQMSEYKRFLVKDIEERKQEQKENL